MTAPARKILLSLCLLIGLNVSAAIAAEEPAARILSFYGNVWVSLGPQNPWHKISRPQDLYIGQSVRTGRLSGVSLLSEDESLIRLSQNAEFKIEAVRISSFWRRATSIVQGLTGSLKSTYRLLTGKLWGRNNNLQQDITYRTPTATIGIRGTEYVIDAQKESTRVQIQEGVVEATNALGDIRIKRGEQGVISAGQVPRSRALDVDSQAENLLWMTPIAEILNVPVYLKRVVNDKPMAADIYQFYREARYADAVDRLSSGIKKQPHNMQLWLLNAWLHIKGGEVAGVNKSLTTLAKYSPDGVTLNEVAAFSALVSGQRDAATRLLDRLEQKHALTDSGWMVRGFLAQARHDLSAAKLAFEKAYRLNPHNLDAATALARIYFGRGQTSLAKALVSQVLQQKPDSIAAHNLKGFILLANNQNDEAAQQFSRVMNTGQADDESWFGLSLLQMHQGRVDEAMKSIATAVLMNPQRSLYLSYWGKMLHQIGRHDKAITVLDSASRLDAQDPTPHLYKAIILRDLNRPVDAIRQLQLADTLNHGRAVHRSRSLLDRDQSVENVDLSRIYSQLGLARWAQKSAQDSIDRDVNNISAQVQRAGAYAAQADLDHAQASAKLLTQLLQPANINSFASYRGYTHLFDMPARDSTVELAVGNHQQQALTLQTNGASTGHRLAWNIETQHARSDGWRDSNGESVDTLALTGQWQPDHDNHWLLSANYLDSEILYDYAKRYQIDQPVESQSRLAQTRISLGIGWQHRFKAGNLVQSFLALSDTDIDQRSNQIDQVIQSGSDLQTRQKMIDNSLQLPQRLLQVQGSLQRAEHQLLFGVIAMHRDSRSKLLNDYGLFDSELNLIDALPGMDERERYDLDIQSLSLYVRDHWRLSEVLTIDMALYLEDMDNANALNGGEWSVDEVMPRLGVAWQASERSTLRLASFKYLLPFSSARLDPTEIAGIPVYRNTREGSVVSETDLVWEYEWESGLLTTSLYRVSDRTTSVIDDQSVRLETTTGGEKKGIDITLDTIYAGQAGLSAKLSRFSLSDEAKPTLDRDENIISAAFHRLYDNGWYFSVEQIYRRIDFSDSARHNTSMPVSNLSLGYVFAHKAQSLELDIQNVFDREFNWLTDEMTDSDSGIAPARLIRLKYAINF